MRHGGLGWHVPARAAATYDYNSIGATTTRPNGTDTQALTWTYSYTSSGLRTKETTQTGTAA